MVLGVLLSPIRMLAKSYIYSYIVCLTHWKLRVKLALDFFLDIFSVKFNSSNLISKTNFYSLSLFHGLCVIYRFVNM